MPKKRKKTWSSEELHLLYLKIWAERGPYSEISGKYLGKEPLSVFFDHLLEKHKYPDLVLEEKNIILCTREEHELKTNGFPVEKHQKLIDWAKNNLI